MDGWSPVGVEGRIAALLEAGTVGAVRDLFPYGVRILCPITLHTGRDVAGWSSWHEVAERVGAQYPPRRALTSMIDSATSPELAIGVDRLVGCSAGPAIEIALHDTGPPASTGITPPPSAAIEGAGDDVLRR